MKNFKLKAPALWVTYFNSEYYIGIEIGSPSGCHVCPFATEHDINNPYREIPNYADPDEGWYDCSLLNKQRIWGETPECSSDNWREKAKKEIEEIAEYSISREIKEEKAKALLSQFFKMIQNDKNKDLTIQQVKDDLFGCQDSEVIRIVEKMISGTES
jgi:hypothetical protein